MKSVAGAFSMMTRPTVQAMALMAIIVTRGGLNMGDAAIDYFGFGRGVISPRISASLFL